VIGRYIRKKIDKPKIRGSFLIMKTIIYCRQIPTRNGIEPELSFLRHIVEGRGNTVFATFHDDPAILGKGRYAGWRGLVGRLADADQVVVGSVSDLPGRTVHDLLKILSLLSEHNVCLYLHREGINTGDGANAILALTAAYRAAKLSDAIRSGQKKARLLGHRTGRPPVPGQVRQRILAYLANDLGPRALGRKHNVSAATIINIRRSVNANLDSIAA
jgi:hypothetical protein